MCKNFPLRDGQDLVQEHSAVKAKCSVNRSYLCKEGEGGGGWREDLGKTLEIGLIEVFPATPKITSV